MTAKELAEKITGREIGHELTRSEEAEIKEAGLVVVFGCSDDNMEFRGAIGAEVGCYNGGTAYITEDGVLRGLCRLDDKCPYFVAARKAARTIEAIWHDRGDPCWTYETDIPHETFEVMEDGAVWCVGIVFSVEALKHGEE